MASEEHLRILAQGVDVWNEWRRDNPSVEPDFYGANLSWANLSKADLSGANLSKTDLSGVNFSWANLSRANLSEAVLSGTMLSEAVLSGAHLSKADLSGANLSGASLWGADSSAANLSKVDLTAASLVNTNLSGATISGCRVFGVSAWGVNLNETIQSGLIITPSAEPEITVDSLDLAQFIYLLLNNQNLRQVIDTITSKAVLILGRFTPERKVVLDAIRDELRRRNYTPILFDFDKPASRNTTETVITLACMSRFVIADLTDPRCSPYEVARIAPNFAVPIQAICHASDTPFAMFPDLQQMHHWVLPPHTYNSLEELLADLPEKIIEPAEAKVLELRKS